MESEMRIIDINIRELLEKLMARTIYWKWI